MTRQARRHWRWLQFLAAPRPAIRTVDVLPPSHSDETTCVFLTAASVFLCAIYIHAFQVYEPPKSASDQRAASATLPFQVLFRDLPGGEQRMFRQMQEGLEEALRTRGGDGNWPTVESLAALEIPPFTRDVLDKSALAWTQVRDGPVVEYIGVPARGTGMPAYLIFVQEPPPTGGEQPSASLVDEEHRLLPDGKLLHVTFWKHPPESLRAADVIRDPALQGWLQIRVKSPFEMTEEP